MFKKVLMCVLLLSVFNLPAFAEEASEEGASETSAQTDYQYFLIEPDIITNYIKPGKRIGYVRITIELLVKSKGDYALLETHEPLIRDKVITIFGEQSEEKVKSISDRDTIRTRCLDEINDVLVSVTGEKPVQDLHFTKYLYQ